MPELSAKQFEDILDVLCKTLNSECVSKDKFQTAAAFENRAREVLSLLLAKHGISADAPLPQVFPDIVLGKFGLEVKFTTNDTWRSIANSVFEGTRSREVEQIYLLFGKMGGAPEVRWGKYDDCVIHVRTSHVPRFEVEMLAKGSLFAKMGISYADFSKLPIADRMKYIRDYARGRLKEGERLWWLEDAPGQAHSLPLQVRLYMGLPQDEKRKLRAEAALLCPQIVKPSRAKNKYVDPAMYLLTYHGVLCPQARDLFSAGSVALRSDSTRGGVYIYRSLKDIEQEMIVAARTLADALFVEYWGHSVSPNKRIEEWLRKADSLAKEWKPSKMLFKK